MNFLAATLVLFMEEAQAFWCLCALVELVIPPGFYSSQVDYVTRLPGTHVGYVTCATYAACVSCVTCFT